MSGILWHATSGEVALVAATPKTVLQIKSPSLQQVLVKGFEIMGKANAGGTDTPVKIRISKNAAAFGTGSTAESGLNDTRDTAIQAAVSASPQLAGLFANFTVEPTTPTYSGIMYEVQPQTGFAYQHVLGQEWKIPAGTSLQFEATAAATETITITAHCEE